MLRPILFALAMIPSAAAAQQGFTCSYGDRGACLGYGDTICSSSAGCSCRRRRNGGTWLAEKAAGLAASAKNAVESALGIQSPSKVFYEIGVNTGEGMALGMDSMKMDVGASAMGLAKAALSPVSSPSQISNNAQNNIKNTTVNFTGNYSSSPRVTDTSTLSKVMAGYA